MKNRLPLTIVCALIASSFLAAALPANGAGPLSGKTICLEPGHGGPDPGAVNMALNLRESDINLDVSYGLSALLEGAGATVVMTRTDTQAAKINQAPYTVCNKAGATIVISVHTNSVNDPDPNGLLVFYSKRADMSLAQALHDAMYSALERLAPDPASFIDFGVRRFGAGVLRRSTMPASLVEPLFMSNPGEANLLITPIYTAPGSGVFNPGCPAFNCRRGQIAQAIYRGVLTYFGIAAS